MGNIQCQEASIALYNQLSNTERLNDVINLRPHNGSHCFRAEFVRGLIEIKGTKVSGISISYPPDVYGNKGPGPATDIETALIDNQDKLCYVSCLGYYDVCRFYSTDELIEEIIRISQFNPSDYSGDDSEQEDFNPEYYHPEYYHPEDLIAEESVPGESVSEQSVSEQSVSNEPIQLDQNTPSLMNQILLN